MAEQGQAPAMAAPFPNPPPYYKHFTKENLARLSEIQKSQSIADGETGGALDKSALPEELRCLVPPEPPADGKYKSFGVQHDVSTTSNHHEFMLTFISSSSSLTSLSPQLA